MSTEILGLDELLSSQASKEVTHNTALRQLEGRSVRVKDKDLTAAPGSPANGDTYIVGPGATGAWSGQSGKIAHYYGGAWHYWSPVEGVRVWINDEDLLYAYDGSAWVAIAGSSTTAPFVDSTALAKGSSDATKLVRLEVDGLTTGTTRVLTVQDADGTIALTADVSKIPQNSQSAAYTTVLSDAGKHIFHPSSDSTARTFTIDSNANVAYAIGTAITFINQNAAGVVTIAITSDTMRLAGAGTTGSRTLAANGVATAIKVTSTEWIISGTGLT